MGEIGVAVVVPRDGAAAPTLAELREHGASALAAYKLPQELQLREALPLTAMEKIDRRALAATRVRTGTGRSPTTNLTPSSAKRRALVELEFSTDQDELRDSIRAVLIKESPVALAREVVETGHGADELWATMTALGWPALTVPEVYGGIGLGTIEAGILAEELGRVIAPGPLLTTVTQYVPVVRETATTAQQARFLGAVARGEVRGALCLAEASGSYDPADVAATAKVDGDDLVLAGTKRFAIEAATADELAVVVRLEGTTGDDGLTVVVVPGSEVNTHPVRTLDGSRAVADVTLDRVRVGPDRVLGTPGVPRRRSVVRSKKPRSPSRSRPSGRARPSSTSRSSTRRTGASSACRSARSRPSSTSSPTC